MLILTFILPLVNFLVGLLFTSFVDGGIYFILVGNIFLCLLISKILLYKIVSTGSSYIISATFWIFIDVLKIKWCFLFDSLTAIMLVVIFFISFLVHLYSLEYMKTDPHVFRFVSYLSLFTFFMIILVTSNNFLQMFVGWEGVGLSSYLLINFWFTRVQANKSAIKAMLMNRIGDFALLLAMFLIHLIFETFSYDVVFALSHRIFNSTILIGNFELISLDLICILLFIGAMGKSAQIGLHTWLPDAMEGPTPVSALIHAATMVTAGVFLITRCSFLLEFSHLSLSIIVVIGALTAFFAATTGLFQNDIKKVIAYSTCSQLGYMVFACGLSNYNVGIFHLSNHAFFKALLFLGAGCIIHAVNDEQDMRKLGGLKALLPFSYSTMLIGSLALAGFPFLSGFYSKDVILELAYSKHSEVGQFCYSFGILAAFCTSFYSVRLLYLVFLAEPNGTKLILCRAHEPSWKMSLPLVVLSIFSCIVGFTTKELFIGFGNNFWGSSVFILPTNHNLLDVEFINITYKLLPLVITFIGSIIAYVLYCYLPYFFYSLKKKFFFQLLYTFFNKKWYFDRLYTQFVSQIVLNKSYAFSYQTLDRGLTEQFGSYGLVNLILRISNTLVNGQTNNITSSIVHLSISILLLLTGFITFKFQFLLVLIISFLFKLKN